MFVGLHVMAAQQFQVPELAMEMSEGEQFMKSAQNVMRHYSVETTQKTLDWIALGGTVCMIYGTRFGAYMLRKKNEREPQPVVYRTPAPQSVNGSGKPAPVHGGFAETPVSVEMEFESE